MKRVARLKELKNKPIGLVSGGRERVYFCEFCQINGHSTPDTKGVLFFNLKKEVGYCQRCQVIIVNDTIPDFDVVARELILSLRGVKQKIQEDEDKKTYTLDGWTTPIKDNQEVYDYLKNRNISDKAIDLYRLRASDYPTNSVVIPNSDLGKLLTDFFQLREVKDNTKIKYRNPMGNKPIFGVDLVNKSQIGLLAEGVFSAIAGASIDTDKYCGLCTYGKSILDHHLRILKELPLEEYYVLYDGGELWPSVKAAKELVKTGYPVSIVFLPYGEDPNSISVSSLYESLEYSKMPYNKTTVPILWEHMILNKRSNDPKRTSWDGIRNHVLKLRKHNEISQSK